MLVPAAAGLQTHQERRQTLQRRLDANRNEQENAGKRLTDARQTRSTLLRNKAVVAQEDIDDSRQHREDLWQRLRVRHFASGAAADSTRDRPDKTSKDDVAAFESAVRDADALADRRFETAEVSAQYTEITRTIDDIEAGLDSLRKKNTQIEQERAKLDMDWQAMWADCPFEPLDLDAMRRWLELHQQIVDAIATHNNAEIARQACENQTWEARDRLLSELRALDIDVSTRQDDPLPLVLELADQTQRDLEASMAKHRRLAESLAEAESDAERCRDDSERAKAAWSEWQDQWSIAIAEAGLPADSDPANASDQIAILENMREMIGQMRDLRDQRIAKMKRDIDQYDSTVAEFVTSTAADLDGRPTDDAVLEIDSRLAQAQQQAGKKKEILQKIAEFEDHLKQQEQKATEAASSLRHLHETAGADTNDALRTAIRHFETHKKLESDQEAVLASLIAEGDGRSIEDLVAECAGEDIDQIIARESAIEAEFKELQHQLETAVQARSEAESAFNKVGGDDSAARAEARRQDAIAEIRAISERYVRARGSALLLEWAIDQYRRKMQAPLLRRAGALFAIVTDGSFQELQVAYSNDQPHLTGVRPDGETVPVTGMSTGTADQLYLALRQASIEEYLERAPSLPFVADDLFINFDDRRAAAGFRALGALAERTQVLFFTHHAHLLDIVKSALGGDIPILNLQD